MRMEMKIFREGKETRAKKKTKTKRSCSEPSHFPDLKEMNALLFPISKTTSMPISNQVNI